MKIPTIIKAPVCNTILTLMLTACSFTTSSVDPDKISSINIIDRNGLSETIATQERLSAYESTDFLGPQPYQKVMRVYGREKNGDVRSCITSYHPNGQIKQYLEAVNSRAFGTYREWFLNGEMKIDAQVIGGSADINTQAESTWLFDGVTRAWNEDGRLIAEISYAKGELEGETFYYHPNGQTWKRVAHAKGVKEGTEAIYLEDGTLLQTNHYVKGLKEGSALRYWSLTQIAYEENYSQGLLMEGCYFDREGRPIAQITNGNGKRAIFGKYALCELQTFSQGLQQGKVQVFDQSKSLIRTYVMKNGEKQGEEIDYFPGSTQPKLLITWNQGLMHGPTKTWYVNGNLESQREMCDNKKNGFLTAWYENGALMFVEEYESDELIKGEYYRLGEKIPVSTIENGRGLATLFNANGNFSRKVTYENGKPIQ